ncbi:nineteen complex-related protein 2-domain-containing protein [Chlamydoabsidia padenii]|nr:nineteen complex-related protein 2-domain-containing protein [Chlamydoabsidia padenii]
MFKKPNRAKNIRRKIETSDDESKDVEEPIVASTPLKSKSDKKKVKRNLGLSFDQQEEDDSDEVFKVKKSKASRKMAADRKLQVPSPSLGLDAQEVDSTYNDDYLASLRANTPALPTSLKNAMDLPGDDDSALLAEKFPKTLTARLGGMAIPDSNAIHAAKKKRELMRQGVVVVDNEQDFIGLDSNTGSRLVREDDDAADDGEGEFEQYIGQEITLDKDEAKKQEQAQRQDARDMIYDAQDDDSDSDDSDQIDRWERDLIKHGGVRAKYEEQVVDPYATPLNYRPAIVPEVSTLPSLDDVLKRLDLISTDITYSMRQYESQLSDAQKGMLDLKVTGDDLDREIQHAGNRHDYFQSLSNTVNDLGEFLDVKIPLLEQLENEAYDIIAAKQEIVQERQWLDDMDLLLSFATVPGHLLEEGDVDMTMDEFGRTPESKFSDTSRQRRQGDRQDRIQKHSSLTDQDEKETAFWSDDELQGGWVEKKDQKLDDIQGKKMDDLLDDVGDEFRTLEAVKSYFEAWKTEYYEDYKNAFGSLSLPAAFEFYVRCELVAWDPFSNPLEFDTMQWHSILSRYGTVEGQHEDADIELLNKVVEKVVLKRIKQLMDTMNPISSKETRYAVHAVEQVSYYVEKHERSFQELMVQVEKSIEKPLLRYATLAESATLLDHQQHNNKQQFIWRQLKYLKNLTSWRRYIPKDNLLSLGQLIVHRIVMPLLRPGVIPGDSDLENEALALCTRLQ